MVQNRFRSKVLWASVIAQVLSIAQLLGVFEKYGLDYGVINDVVAYALQIFVLFGVLNNPTSKDSL